MVVDGFTGAIAVGDTFTVAAHTTVYTITAHTETSTNTTSITFTPVLVDAAVDDDTVNVKTHILEINIGEGTLTYDEKRKMEYQLNRGRLNTVREGNEEPVDVRLDFLWDFLRSASGATIPTIEEAFKKIGAASGWISSATDKCEPYAVDVIVTYTPPCTGIQPEQIILKDFRWESLNHDAKGGSVAVTGKCNIKTATVARLSA
jgi:hypothetical protein